MLFSVIIPAYNCENTLFNTIESIEAVDLEDMEIIIVNDGSTDNTSMICESILNKYSNVRCFCQKNSGVSASRNIGIQKAIGKYVLFWDADDLADPNLLRKCMFKALEVDVDMVIFGMLIYRFYKGNIFQIEEKTCEKQEIINQGDLANRIDWLFDINYLSSSCNKIVKREICEKISFVTSKMCFEDLLYSLNLLKICKSIYLMPDLTYIYSVNHSTGKPPREKRIEDFDFYLKDFQKVVMNLEASLGTYLLGLRERIGLIYGWMLSNKLSSSTLRELKTIDKPKMRITLFGKDFVPQSKICNLFFDNKLFELRVYCKCRRIKRKLRLKLKCIMFKHKHSNGD